MDEENELRCEVCGAKLTGEEGMMICFSCQEQDEEFSSLFNDEALV